MELLKKMKVSESSVGSIDKLKLYNKVNLLASRGEKRILIVDKEFNTLSEYKYKEAEELNDFTLNDADQPLYAFGLEYRKRILAGALKITPEGKMEKIAVGAGSGFLQMQCVFSKNMFDNRHFLVILDKHSTKREVIMSTVASSGTDLSAVSEGKLKMIEKVSFALPQEMNGDNLTSHSFAAFDKAGNRLLMIGKYGSDKHTSVWTENYEEQVPLYKRTSAIYLKKILKDGTQTEWAEVCELEARSMENHFELLDNGNVFVGNDVVFGKNIEEDLDDKNYSPFDKKAYEVDADGKIVKTYAYRLDPKELAEKYFPDRKERPLGVNVGWVKGPNGKMELIVFLSFVGEAYKSSTGLLHFGWN